MAATVAHIWHRRTLDSVRGRPLEAVKWIAFALMLLDHFAAYAVGVIDPFAEFAGALVLPLFAFAFAVGIAPLNADRRTSLLVRLFFWAGIAQLCAMLARDAVPVNVLFSFAAAVALDLARERDFNGWERLALLSTAALFGWYVEFAYVGVALIFALMQWARSGRGDWLLVVAAALVMLTIPNRSFGACAAPAVLALVLWSGAGADRRAGVFYVAYAAQFVVMAVLAMVLRA